MGIFDFFNILIKRKVLILSGTFLFVMLMIVYLATMSATFYVNTIIQLGDEVVIGDPVITKSSIELVDKFSAMEALKLQGLAVPGIKVINPEKTRFLDISMSSGKEGLDFAIKFLKKLNDVVLSKHKELFREVRLDLERNLELINLRVGALKGEKVLLKQRFSLLKEKREGIKIQIEKVEKRLLFLQKKMSQLSSKADSNNTLSILAYNNEAIANQRYLGELRERLGSGVPNRKVDVEADIARIESEVKELLSTKSGIRSRLEFLKETVVVKAPAFQDISHRHRQTLYIAMAAIFGFCIFVLIAVFFDYRDSLKD